MQIEIFTLLSIYLNPWDKFFQKKKKKILGINLEYKEKWGRGNLHGSSHQSRADPAKQNFKIRLHSSIKNNLNNKIE